MSTSEGIDNVRYFYDIKPDRPDYDVLDIGGIVSE